MDIELKKCPFCGSEASIMWKMGTGRADKFAFYHVECDLCGASGRSFRIYTGDETPRGSEDEWSNDAACKAIVFWNRRKPEERNV